MFAVAADAIKTAQLIECEPIIAAPSHAPPAGGCECVRPPGHTGVAARLHHASLGATSSLHVGPRIPNPPPSVSTHSGVAAQIGGNWSVRRKSLSRRAAGRGGGVWGGQFASRSREANLIKVNVILVNAV